MSDRTINVSDATGWPSGNFYLIIGDPNITAKELVYVVSRTGNVLTVNRAEPTSDGGGYSSPFVSTPRLWAANTTFIGQHITKQWNRPFAAFSSGSGIVGGDRAAISEQWQVPRYSWAGWATTDGSYGNGYYGHQNYHSLYAPWTNYYGYTYQNPWNGDEFWVQFRVKTDPAWWQNVMADATDLTWNHKLAFIQAVMSCPQQLCPVFISPGYLYTGYRVPFQTMTYWGQTRAGGIAILSDQLTTERDDLMQPGGPYGSTCRYAPTPSGTVTNCWEWPSDGTINFKVAGWTEHEQA